MHRSILECLLCDCEDCEKRRQRIAELADAEASMPYDDSLEWLRLVLPAGNA